MSCNCGNNKCNKNKCKICKERETFQCVPDCKFITCEEVIDWRCVLVNCDGAYIQLNYNSGGTNGGSQLPPPDEAEVPLPRRRETTIPPGTSVPLNINKTITIPPCITLNALFQLWTAANNPSLQQGVMNGTECAIVIDADIIKQSAQIVVHFNNPPITQAAGCSITGYEVEVKHINTNIIYTFPVSYSNSGNYILNIVPVGSMSFSSGNTYSIRIKTNTNCGVGLNNSCYGLTYYVTY